MSTKPVTLVHVAIERDWRDVYEYACQPENMQHWAAGLANGLVPDGDDWLADGGPLGSARVRFERRNNHGSIDHAVTLPSGDSVHNVLRVVPNGDGAEVIFMLLRSDGASDETYDRDRDQVQTDLEKLKAILER